MTRPTFLRRFLAHDPARVAIQYGEQALSFGHLRELGEATAGWLRAQGVTPGDRVCIHLDTSIDLLAAHLGCMAVGAVRVPLNAHYRAIELAPIVEDAAPALAFSASPACFPGVPTFSAPGRGPPVCDWAGLDDVTGLLFTSGTTGRAKGAPQTWTMWESNLDALQARWQLGDRDVLLLTLPLFHTHGLVVGLHGAWLRGARVVLRDRFDAVEPPAEVTHFYGVPTYFRRWLPLMRVRPELFGGFRLLVSGSDGLPVEVSDAIFAATGHRILERYGMTETVMIASNPGAGERRAGSVGTALPGTDIRVIDGEVQVRGPGVFGGYWPRAEADAAAFTADGYFRTGDAGELDPDGYLRIIGRKKDLIIVGGVNVSPAEVERVLATVPGVADVGCCGLYDADLNEVVGAAVVSDGTVEEGELRGLLEAAARQLSGLKRPRRVAFVAGLPKNALGKLQRGRIAGEAFGG